MNITTFGCSMDQELFQKLYNASFSDQYKVIAGVYERCEVKFLPEKFAELVVRECAELATKEYNNRSAIHGNDLLEHFGIK